MSLMSAKLLLVDTNVWLDYYLRNEPRCEAAAKLIEYAALGKTSLLYSPTTAKDLFYLIPRRLKLQSGGDGASYRSSAWACLQHLMEVAIAAPLASGECEFARMLRKDFNDFEDNLLLAVAETANVDFIVTNDKELLNTMGEVCITPERATELLDMSAL